MSTSFWVSLFVASLFVDIVENHIEPTIATTTDWTIEFIDNGVTTIRNLQESITDRIEELSD